jgi:hypothetical protein
LILIAHKSGTDFRHQEIGFKINSPVFFLPEFTNKPRSSNDFMVRKNVGRDIEEVKGCEIKLAVVMMLPSELQSPPAKYKLFWFSLSSDKPTLDSMLSSIALSEIIFLRIVSIGSKYSQYSL